MDFSRFVELGVQFVGGPRPGEALRHIKQRKAFGRTTIVCHGASVTFDAKKRGPAEGGGGRECWDTSASSTFVYDGREKDIHCLTRNIDALQAHGIDLLGWWFAGGGTIPDGAKR